MVLVRCPAAGGSEEGVPGEGPDSIFGGNLLYLGITVSEWLCAKLGRQRNLPTSTEGGSEVVSPSSRVRGTDGGGSQQKAGDEL